MISVCMATYNGEKYLAEQLDSILCQISDDDELIISDDGSKDSTLRIINDYAVKFKNIILIDGPKQGVIKNFENALKLAKGEYIFLTDQDDIWKKNKVQTILKYFTSTGCQVVLHDADIIDANLNIISESFYKHRGSKQGLLRNIYKNSYLGCCMAFTKKTLNQALPFPNNIEMHDWWIGLIGESNKSTLFISEKLISYRRHGNNVSSFHHHPLPKMISNRLCLLLQLVKRKAHLQND